MFIILILAFLSLPSAANAWSFGKTDNGSSGVFIYHIPDDDSNDSTGNSAKDTQGKDVTENTASSSGKDIVSDDVTADTSGKTAEEEPEEIVSEAEEAENADVSESEEYQIADMYSDVLQGYASYDENADNGDIVSLEDTLDVYQAIKIKTPAKVGTQKYYPGTSMNSSLYSTLNTAEYSIAPVSGTSYTKKNGFTAGTIYNQGIDYAELEQTTGVFSRYETKHFAISTAYAKTVNTTNNNYNDNFYVAPELILNQYFSLREVLSADIVLNRKKMETILSINPFGNKDKDRLRLELGVNSTYDETNALLKSQFKFSTSFKL